jgi:hypothetical protein
VEEHLYITEYEENLSDVEFNYLMKWMSHSLFYTAVNDDSEDNDITQDFVLQDVKN